MCSIVWSSCPTLSGMDIIIKNLIWVDAVLLDTPENGNKTVRIRQSGGCKASNLLAAFWRYVSKFILEILPFF